MFIFITTSIIVVHVESILKLGRWGRHVNFVWGTLYTGRGWNRRTPGVETSCECIEQAENKSGPPTLGLGEGQPHQKSQACYKCCTGLQIWK
jgi:hypothetical protein